MRTAIKMAVSILLFGGALSASRPAAGTVSDSADAYLSSWARQGRFSGVVLIAKGDKVLLRKGYGMADYEHDVPNTPQTIFRIGSTTKMFTALAVLQLEEKGLFSVNDPAAKYVPEMPAEWRAITIHQLLTHTSGIPDFASAASYGNYDDPRRIEAALQEFAGKPLLNAPGETFHYSNSGYMLLGRIIEKLSGETYADYVAENIFRPAGMVDTAYDSNGPLLKRRACGYTFSGESLRNAPREDMRWAHSGGAVHSTVDDLYRFDRALKAGKLFGSVQKKAASPYTHSTAPPPFEIDADYGYGTFIGKHFGHAFVGHSGWVAGFTTQFTRYPDDDAVIMVLSNIESMNYQPISMGLAAILFGADYRLPAEHKIVHPSADVLARYVGRYQLGPMEVNVTMQDGRLFAMGTGQRNPYGMIAYSDTQFYFNDIDSEASFVAEGKDRAKQLVIKMSGREMALNRVTEAQTVTPPPK